MRRNDKKIESECDIIEILQRGEICFLSMVDDGKPYVVPLNYGYADGALFFHSAPEGRKIDVLKGDPQVCFTVARQRGEVQRHAEGSVCHVDSDSVICCGRARTVEDLRERQSVLDSFNHSFRPDADPISLDDAAKCGAVEIEITEMTGRRERQRKCPFWKYRFGD